jgi:hypothetical protein
MPKCGIATEGPASASVLEEICRRHGVICKVLKTEGKPKLKKDFHKLLKVLKNGPFRAKRFLVVPDLHPETGCVGEAQIWKAEIESKFPEAVLCLAIWETEEWLLADPKALEDYIGVKIDSRQPDKVGEPRPSRRLEEAFRQARGYGKGSAFDKRNDGAELAKRIDLKTARSKSPSLDRFLTKLGG